MADETDTETAQADIAEIENAEENEKAELEAAEEAGIDLEAENVADDKKDILWALVKPLEDMTLDEQLEAIRRIREMRKVRLSVSKKKSALDNILAQLTPERASSLLKQLEAQMQAIQDENNKNKK
jgi:hypothetical protein